MHISISPTKGATTFSPLSNAFNRTTKDGQVPVVNFLLGSQYNTKLGGETSTTSVGNIINDTSVITASKLEIAGESSDGTEVEKIISYVPFMYFFPGVRIIAQAEVQDSDVGSGPIPVQRIRYEFEDLGTTDKIIVDVQGGDGNAQLVFREVVNNVETVLVTTELTVAVKDITWELDFLEDGVTKLFYKEPSGSKTRVFNGTINAVIGEAKVSVRLILDQQTVKTVKTDVLWIFYPNVFVGYDIPDLTNKTKGRIKIFDTNNSVSETDWTEVFSSDHTFTGQRVVENGLIRCHFKIDPKMEVFGWDGAAWVSTGSLIAKSSQGDLATTLHDVIFTIFNDGQAKITVKYGIVDHIIDMKRGSPSVRVTTNSTQSRFTTSHRRFALSVDNTTTDIPDFNQKNTDDVNRGNPLNLSPTVNPFIFTDDSNVTTGLDLLDDNWYAWYNENDASDMVGFLGNISAPTALQLSAISSTQLEHIDWTWGINGVFCVGVLPSDSSVDINGIPTPFNIGNIDTYVKWRSTEGIVGFDQRPFLRKKR